MAYSALCVLACNQFPARGRPTSRPRASNSLLVAPVGPQVPEVLERATLRWPSISLLAGARRDPIECLNGYEIQLSRGKNCQSWAPAIDSGAEGIRPGWNYSFARPVGVPSSAAERKRAEFKIQFTFLPPPSGRRGVRPSHLADRARLTGQISMRPPGR